MLLSGSALWFSRSRLALTQKLLLVLPILLLPLIVCRDSRIQESLRLLADADRLAMLYNWPKAAALYAQAESLFTQSGDKKMLCWPGLATFGQQPTAA